MAVKLFKLKMIADDPREDPASCCKLGHPDAMPCDREALVRPMTGLFHEIYRNRHGSRQPSSKQSR